MKKLLYLGIVLMFASWWYLSSESQVSTEIRPWGLPNPNAEGEFSTIKIDNLEVMTEDCREMEWDEAKEVFDELGDGWRLPTKDELNILYENRAKIGGFNTNHHSYYWSSEDNGAGYPDDEYPWSHAWTNHFDGGGEHKLPKKYAYYVRAVRSI
tara:strand:- start:149 stop:610 length:462 start_codon:yes stop_codon:yes gene_type:complete